VFYSATQKSENAIEGQAPGATDRKILSMLDEELTSLDGLTADQIKGGGVILYILGVAYMFLALSICCDEFFVPALEVMSEKLGVSDEVAGATLMAAGGSAPELFTSFIGTFQGSDVGFGTIVGSAVFNVLFVIAMCALFSTEVLKLTWWPLFRDSIYYSFSLTMLAIFFGVISPNVMEAWEALVLFGMYIGYVILMKYHLKAQAFVLSLKASFCPGSSVEANLTEKPETELQDYAGIQGEERTSFTQPSTFRSGIVQLMLSNKPMLETAGIYAVSKIQGNAFETFTQIDADQSGYIDSEELKELLCKLTENSETITEQKVDELMKLLDTSGDGKIDFNEFSAWYLRSETRIQAELKDAFNKADDDNSGKILEHQLKAVLRTLSPQIEIDDDNIAKVFAELDEDKDGHITMEEFEKWYATSDFYSQKKVAVNQEADSADGPDLSWPEGWQAQLMYLIAAPLLFSMYYTLPPCKQPGWRNWCYLTFLGSIIWIGVYSYFMVWWATITGAAFGINATVMGLTFLAAGTSVPDLLSSVIVAKQGRGDMAVSSSLGSNIFDVLVGLPIPWLAYALIKGTPVTVGAKSLGISIVVLIGMLVLVIGTIAYNDWKLTNNLGYTMLVFYVLFVIQDLWRSFGEED